MPLLFSYVDTTVPISSLKSAAKIFFELKSFEELMAYARQWEIEIISFDELKYYFYSKNNALYFLFHGGEYFHKLPGGKNNGNK